MLTGRQDVTSRPCSPRAFFANLVPWQAALGGQWAKFEKQLRDELSQLGGSLNIESGGGASGNRVTVAASTDNISLAGWSERQGESPYMDGPRRVTLRVDHNGAEELAPLGQAILVRGTETLTAMSPYLPDDERAQRLNALRSAKSS